MKIHPRCFLSLEWNLLAWFSGSCCRAIASSTLGFSSRSKLIFGRDHETDIPDIIVISYQVWAYLNSQLIWQRPHPLLHMPWTIQCRFSISFYFVGRWYFSHLSYWKQEFLYSTLVAAVVVLIICMSSFGQHFGHLAMCCGDAELKCTAPVPIQDSSRRDEQWPQELSPRHFEFSPVKGSPWSAGRSRSRKICWWWHHMTLYHSCLMGQSTARSVMSGACTDLGGAWLLSMTAHGHSSQSLGRLKGPVRASYSRKEKMGQGRVCVFVCMLNITWRLKERQWIHFFD